MRTIWDWKDPGLGKRRGLRDDNDYACGDPRGDDSCEKAKRPQRGNHGG